MDCFCRRCNGEGPSCFEGGEHEYNGATCRTCGRTDGVILGALRYEKAQREGRSHGDHFHQTMDAKARCKTPLKLEWGHAEWCKREPFFEDGTCECAWEATRDSMLAENP